MMKISLPRVSLIVMLLGLFSVASAQKQNAVSIHSSGYLPGYTEVLDLEMMEERTSYLCYSYNKDTENLTLLFLNPFPIFPTEESVEAVYDETAKKLVLYVTSFYDPSVPAPTTRIDRQWHAVITDVPMEVATIVAEFVQEQASANKQPKTQVSTWDFSVSLETEPEGVEFKN